MLEIKQKQERVTISINIPKDQIKLLRWLKKENNVSISHIVEEAISNAFPEPVNERE